MNPVYVNLYGWKQVREKICNRLSQPKIDSVRVNLTYESRMHNMLEFLDATGQYNDRFKIRIIQLG
jgi:hypothetical protein